MRVISSAIGRRQALTRALLTIGSASMPWLHPTAPVSAAMYTVVPTGTVVEKRARLAQVEQQFKLTPEDPYVFGEKAQLEADIVALGRNQAFVERLSSDMASGTRNFTQSLRIGVPDMEAAVDFWTGGCGALVVDTRLVGGTNVTTIGFGPQSLRVEDGAKFALELVEGRPSLYDENSALQYLQLAIPVFRLSQAMRFGGDIQSAYGWTSLLAPGGLPLRVRIDESRRDPFEFVALRTSNLKQTAAHYEHLGMRQINVQPSRKKLQLTQYSNTIFENSDATEPDREPGSILMGYDDPSLSTGVLLLPPLKRAQPSAGQTPPQLRFVTGSPPDSSAPLADPEGIGNLLVSSTAFEAGLKRG